jgi:cyclophilin family peptidyl-prolyl cis-trans isomerase
MKPSAWLAVFLALPLVSLAGCVETSNTTGAGTGSCSGITKASLAGLAIPAGHSVVALATKQGCIVAEMFEDKAPITVQNFLNYTRAGFYDNTLIHRISKSFVLQGGSVDAGTGQSKGALHPPIKNEARTSGLHNDAYTFSMARTGQPDSATSQFFINVKDNRDCLDAITGKCDQTRNGYAAFAKVVKGTEVVDAIHALPATTSSKHPYCLPIEDPQGGSCPVDPVTIVSARVL